MFSSKQNKINCWEELLSAPVTLDENQAYHLKKTLFLAPYPVQSYKKGVGVGGQKQMAPDKYGHIDKMEDSSWKKKNNYKLMHKDSMQR